MRDIGAEPSHSTCPFNPLYPQPAQQAGTAPHSYDYHANPQFTASIFGGAVTTTTMTSISACSVKRFTVLSQVSATTAIGSVSAPYCIRNLDRETPQSG